MAGWSCYGGANLGRQQIQTSIDGRGYDASFMDQPATVIVTRRAEPGDLPALAEIEAHAFLTDRLSPRSLRDYLKSASAALIVAEETTAGIVGYALVRFRRGTSVARLYSIAVSDKARGRGIGEQLIAAAEEEARQSGELFMRLEVRADNAAAMALYRRLGYREFGRHLGYYEDNADAIRLEKRIIGHAPATAREVPYYAQTTDFTCGPAAMMMAMAAAGLEVPFSRRLEFELWREATSIYLISAPGGCDPLGLAVTLARRGLQVSAHVNQPGPYFVDGQRAVKRRDIMEEAQRAFREEAAERGIPVRYAALSRDQLLSDLDRGAVAIVLISTYRMYRQRIPHWIVAYGHDQHYIFAHDPFVDPDEMEDALDKAGLAIPTEEFDHIAAYGKARLRAAVVVEPKKEE